MQSPPASEDPAQAASLRDTGLVPATSPGETEIPGGGPAPGGGPGADEGSNSGACPGLSAGEGTADPRGERGQLNLTDPKAIRALAHPLRWALLEALGQAGTLTATQASEMLGESPANCAFHLRTLAKYGFVEEAGGGRGRERPWRQAYDGMSWRTSHQDPQVSMAAEALDRVWMDRLLSRARGSLTSMNSWPEAFGEGSLGASSSRLYVTPEEAREVHAEIRKTFERLAGAHHRFAARRDPKLRPPDAVPVEFVLLGYPILDSPPPLPSAGEADGGDDGDDDDTVG